jgi:hypothetical protein
MLKYQILVTLTDAETDELYTEFRQSIFDSYNADEFDNVIEQFNELIAFAKKHYDCEDTYEIDAYILNEKNEAIY